MVEEESKQDKGVRVVKADKKESLDREWNKMDDAHYGRRINWKEKDFKFKAVENGKTVGLIEGSCAGGIVYIEALISSEEARGKGIGTTLIKKAEEFGKKMGAHRTWLITGKNWTENKFYQKLGFVKVGELPDFHFHVDFVVYTRKIV